MKQLVGFYWTLPVKWAGFRSLPPDAEAAARLSRTIRYQRELVHAWTRSEHCKLSCEIVCIESEPDRASELTLDIIAKGLKGIPKSDVELVYVDFAEADGSRYNRHIMYDLESAGLTLNQLSPDPIQIDGKLFDPIKHFRNWRATNEIERKARHATAASAMAEALILFPAGYGRWSAIAAHLNAREITTVTGREWTSDTVKKAAAKLTGTEVGRASIDLQTFD